MTYESPRFYGQYVWYTVYVVDDAFSTRFLVNRSNVVDDYDCDGGGFFFVYTQGSCNFIGLSVNQEDCD